jgi:hypothetical protein
MTFMDLMKIGLVPDAPDPSFMWEDENSVVPYMAEAWLVSEERTFANRVQGHIRESLKVYEMLKENLRVTARERGVSEADFAPVVYGLLHVVDSKDITYVYGIKHPEPLGFFQTITAQVLKRLLEQGVPARLVDFDRQAFLAWFAKQEFASDSKKVIYDSMELWAQVKANQNEYGTLFQHFKTMSSIFTMGNVSKTMDNVSTMRNVSKAMGSVSEVEGNFSKTLGTVSKAEGNVVREKPPRRRPRRMHR